MAFQFDFFSISLLSRHSHLLGILEPRFFFSPASLFYLLFSVAIILQIGRPIEPGEVSMCFYGITARDLSHARAAVNFVVLFRKLWCSYLGVLLKDFAGGLSLEWPNVVVCRVDALEAELIATKKDIISSAAIKFVNRFPSLQGGCWVEFGYTDNAAVYHTKFFFLSFCPIFGILVTKSVFSIGVKFTVGVSKLIS
nr:uncharacterized protein LOC108170421 isoform X1 [Malus domestica]